MYEKLLIPIDFSDDSQYVVQCLSHIPHIKDVVLLHVTQSLYLVKRPDAINPDVDYARLRLEEMKKNIHMPRSRIRVIVEEITGGSIADAIHAVAMREGATLIMMGRRGRGVIETLLIGSTASDILKYGTKNLLLIHPPHPEIATSQSPTFCPDLFSHIMICSDFSKPDIEERCLSDIICNRNVTIFHVISTGDSKEEVQSHTDSALARLKNIQEKLSPYAKEIVTRVAVGDAAQEILSYSGQDDISLIVLKSTGDKGIIRNLLGTTTESVARSTKKPVLILRQNEENACAK